MNIKVFDVEKEYLTMEEDVWWGIVESDNGYAVDINYFTTEEYWDNDTLVEEEQYCYLYPCYPDENGVPYINTSKWISYDLNFDDPAWKEKLIDATTHYLMEIIKEDER